MNKCIECSHFDIRTFPRHTAENLAKCKKMASGKFISINRDKACDDFEMAKEEITVKRRQWRDSVR